jgi:uncharacterized membrane protein
MQRGEATAGTNVQPGAVTAPPRRHALPPITPIAGVDDMPPLAAGGDRLRQFALWLAFGARGALAVLAVLWLGWLVGDGGVGPVVISQLRGLIAVADWLAVALALGAVLACSFWLLRRRDRRPDPLARFAEQVRRADSTAN